jgi:uncharacterized protein YbjQ (UPF0145 family)
MIDEIGRLLNLSPDQLWWLRLGLYILAAAIVLYFIQRVAMFVRGLRPARLNPKLARYAGDDDPTVQARRQMASRVRSTSSTDQIPGYKIIQAVDTMYVDGFRTPADALEGLKAAAAEKGANAVINVHLERSSVGRCAARGDAVLAESTGQAYTPPSQPIELEARPPAPPPAAPKKKDRGQGPDGPMPR